VFIVVNETDGTGSRRAENITRVRALFVDADGPEQVDSCELAFKRVAIVPSATVCSSPGKKHFYFSVDDVSPSEFSTVQKALIHKLETDPAVSDLPRVMRLPGTLHWKNATTPHLVTLEIPNGQRTVYTSGELIVKLELDLTSVSAVRAAVDPSVSALSTLSNEERLRIARLFGVDVSVNDALSAGLETNVEEIRSAALSIPSTALAAEGDWIKVARALAYEARIYKTQAEELYAILDDCSAKAPNYDLVDNRRRWDRYVLEASRSPNPITIGTLFAIAKQHGWQGWTPSVITYSR
jgi:Primase C terminal 2 (PriCT-2)/RepB DNA-primase N-terminal domain